MFHERPDPVVALDLWDQDRKSEREKGERTRAIALAARSIADTGSWRGDVVQVWENRGLSKHQLDGTEFVPVDEVSAIALREAYHDSYSRNDERYAQLQLQVSRPDSKVEVIAYFARETVLVDGREVTDDQQLYAIEHLLDHLESNQTSDGS